LDDYKLGVQESKFADIIWSAEPVGSAKLVKLAEDALNWKKSTTFTMLRRLCERGIFKNENAVVTALMSRDEFYSGQSRHYVEDTFGGSLPRFIASFFGGKEMTEEHIAELNRMIDEYEGKGDDNG